MAGEIGDYCGIDFIGGGLGAVDKIDGAVLQDKDHFLVVTPTVFAPLSLDADSGAGESSPQIIAPNTNPGNKRWILTGGVFASLISYGKVGINESSPERSLHITGVDTGAGNFDSYANAIIEDTGTSWLYFMSDIAGNAGIAWGNTADPFVSCVNYNHDGDYLRFYVNNAERMRIESDGKVGIGTLNPVTLLHLKGALAEFRFEEDTAGILVDFRTSAAGSFVIEQNYDTDAVGHIYIRPTLTGQTFTKNLHLCDQGGNVLIGGKLGVNDNVPNSQIDVTGDINTTLNYKVDDVQVISNQGAIVADATDPATTMARLNELIARCRAHGLIATA